MLSADLFTSMNIASLGISPDLSASQLCVPCTPEVTAMKREREEVRCWRAAVEERLVDRTTLWLGCSGSMTRVNSRRTVQIQWCGDISVACSILLIVAQSQPIYEQE